MDKETKDGIVGLTSQLIGFKTVKTNLNELKAVIDFIQQMFSGEDVAIKRFEQKGKYSIIILPKGISKPKLLIVSHADVVEAEDPDFTAKVKGNKLFGRGSADMKGGLAVSLLLFKKHYKYSSIGLIITTDEEVGGYDGAVPLSKKYKADLALASEPSQFRIITKEKGVVWAKLTAKGMACHGARPWLGKNAAEMLMEAYARLRAEFPHVLQDSWMTTMNTGIIKGGDAPNRVPATAEMVLDFRYTETFTADQIIKKIRNLAGKDISVDIIDQNPLLINKEGDLRIADLALSFEKVTGKKAPLVSENGASDLMHFSEKGLSCAVFGPKGANYHGKDEYVEIQSLVDTYLVIEEHILTFCKKN